MARSEVELKDLKIRLTLDQIDWLRAEAQRTGDSLSSCVRQLIQEKIDSKHNLQ